MLTNTVWIIITQNIIFLGLNLQNVYATCQHLQVSAHMKAALLRPFGDVSR